MTPVASVIMATRNRKDELARAIRSCQEQSVPVEVIVRDDGSTDGTPELMAREFPWVNYVHSAKPRGSIANRNDAAQAASTNYLISLDDDAAFASPRTVEQTLGEFSHPRIWAVGIPFVDVNYGPTVLQRSPDSEIRLIWYFRGCAAAWRRDLFLAAGGYSPVLYHMAEEPDVCFRLLGRGYVTRLGTADPVNHYESPNRDRRRIAGQVARNAVLRHWMTTPAPPALWYVPGSSITNMLYGLKIGAAKATIAGVGEAWRWIIDGTAKRDPVSLKTLAACDWIREHPGCLLSEVESRLEPMRQD